MKRPLVKQYWEESERGWGVRPDGVSFHLSMADRDRYIAKYWEEEKKNNLTGTVPDEYERPVGEPQLVEVEVDQTVIRAMKKYHGYRTYNQDKHYPK